MMVRKASVVHVTYRGTYIEWKPDRGGSVGDRGPNYDTSNVKRMKKVNCFCLMVMRLSEQMNTFVFVVDDDGVYSQHLYQCHHLV